jgi:hypothetical protein
MPNVVSMMQPMIFDTFVVMCMVVSWLRSLIFCVVGFVIARFPYVLRGVGL